MAKISDWTERHRPSSESHLEVNESQRQKIFELKKVVSENEKNKNLLQGYKKVIEDLSIKLRKNS